MNGALQGIRVADFSHVMAGPYCTMVLADMGADVVKVEPPHGDATRGLMARADGHDSPFYLCLNRNKRGIVLDLQSAEGQQVALDLISRADVLVESFATGVMDRLGLGPQAMAERFPRLIYCSVSAYGRAGPFAYRAGYDPIVQGETGLMDLNGHEGGEPHKTAVPIVDQATGMYAAQAVLAALFARERTGHGQFIDVPLFDSAASLTTYHTISYLTGGPSPQRQGNSSPVAGPVGLYHASDGAFFMTVAGERVWVKLVEAMGCPPELRDERFASNFLRVRHQPELDAALANLFVRQTLEHWLGLLREAGVPVGPVRSIAQAAESPEMKASDVIVQAPHASLGHVPHLRLPMRLAGTPLTVRHAAPLLGQHTREVLGGLLGYEAAKVERLLAGGAARDQSREEMAA